MTPKMNFHVSWKFPFIHNYIYIYMFSIRSTQNCTATFITCPSHFEEIFHSRLWIFCPLNDLLILCSFEFIECLGEQCVLFNICQSKHVFQCQNFSKKKHYIYWASTYSLFIFSIPAKSPVYASILQSHKQTFFI